MEVGRHGSRKIGGVGILLDLFVVSKKSHYLTVEFGKFFFVLFLKAVGKGFFMGDEMSGDPLAEKKLVTVVLL